MLSRSLTRLSSLPSAENERLRTFSIVLRFAERFLEFVEIVRLRSDGRASRIAAGDITTNKHLSLNEPLRTTRALPESSIVIPVQLILPGPIRIRGIPLGIVSIQFAGPENHGVAVASGVMK